MAKEIQQANISLDFYDVKAARIEDQVFLDCYGRTNSGGLY